MKTQLSLDPNTSVKVRSAVTIADVGPFTDANYPVSENGVTQPSGYRAVSLFLRFNGGTNPSARVTLLHRTAQGPVVGGSGWIQGVQSTPLPDSAPFVADVMGRDFFPVITNITGAPTSVDVYAMGWESYRYDGPRAA